MLPVSLRTLTTALGLGAMLVVTACAPDDPSATGQEEPSPEPTVTETVTDEPQSPKSFAISAIVTS